MEYPPHTQHGEGRTPETPRTPRQVERGAFVERVRKNKKRLAAEVGVEAEKSNNQQTKKAVSPEAAPEVPRRSRSRRIGEGILRMLKQRPRAEETPPSEPVEMPEQRQAEQQQVSPEELPIYERANKMRRFARMVIHRVRKEVREEPIRARHDSAETTPLNTEPLQEAAEELREAADDLSETMRDVRREGRMSAEPQPESASKTTSEAAVQSAAENGSDYDANDDTAEVQPTVSQRITERMREYEQQSEVDKATALTALLLGAIAVVVAGHEFGARRRLQRKHKSLTRLVGQQEKIVESQQQQIDQQKQETAYAQLRQQQTDGMQRRERSAYYDRLSTLTHRQAEVTREVTDELRQQIPQEHQAVKAEVQPLIAAFERSRSDNRLAVPVERSEQPQVADRKKTPERRDVRADESTSASAVVDSTTITPNSMWSQKPLSKAPLSPAAQREAAARKARADRISSEAWLYGAGLALVAVGVIIAMLLN